MLCPNAGPLDFGNSCVRTSWSALLPAIFVFLLCTPSLLPKGSSRIFGPLRGQFTQYLTLHEAEALDLSGATLLDEREVTTQVEVENLVPLWRTIVLAFVALIESFFWLATAGYTFTVGTDSPWSGISSVLIALTWVYAACRPVAKPQPTPPYDLFVLYTIHLVMGIILVGGIVHSNDVYGTPMPPTAVLVVLALNLVAILVVLGVVVNMPMGIRSNRVNKSDIVRYTTS